MIDGRLSYVDRKLSLDGRTNIIVVNVDSTNVMVQVNTRYILTQNNSGTDALGNQLAPYSATMSFNTGQSATSSGGTIYRSTGVMETTILDLVR